ncbi:Precorrin-6A reductase [compost metagenome]
MRCLQGQTGGEQYEVIGARGPFSLGDERQLFARLGSDVLISKNSGSQSTEPKLQVARELGLPVLILKRPELPAVAREFDSVEGLWQALATYLDIP